MIILLISIEALFRILAIRRIMVPIAMLCFFSKKVFGDGAFFNIEITLAGYSDIS